MELTEAKMNAWIGNFLSFETKIKDKLQGTRVGDKNCEVLASNV